MCAYVWTYLVEVAHNLHAALNLEPCRKRPRSWLRWWLRAQSWWTLSRCSRFKSPFPPAPLPRGA